MVSFPIKRIFILILSIITGFLISEFIFRNVIGFPVYGVEKKVYGIKASSAKQNIFKPYSKLWNVEGGNQVILRNNFGFPGKDINVNSNSKYIVLLGSSFMEALQFSAEKTTAGLLYSQAKQIDNNFEVVNLGYSGHDPFDDWRRLKYFEEKFPPEIVILVIESNYENWLKRQTHPLTFSLPANFGKEDNSRITKVNKYLRNNSSIIAALAEYIKDSNEEGTNPITEKNNSKKSDSLDSYIPQDLFVCIQQFHKDYKDKFILVAVTENPAQNIKLKDFCDSNGISCIYSNTLLKKENRIKGKGHLNEQGNKELANILYRGLVEIYQK